MKFLGLDGLKNFLAQLKLLFVPLTRKVNGKELSEDITLTATDIGVDVDAVISEAKEYTDVEVAQKSQVQFITWEPND
jgi:hypothetical protein